MDSHGNSAFIPSTTPSSLAVFFQAPQVAIFLLIAEVVLGFLGAAATVGAVKLVTGSGFAGRHEKHR